MWEGQAGFQRFDSKPSQICRWHHSWRAPNASAGCHGHHPGPSGPGLDIWAQAPSIGVEPWTRSFSPRGALRAASHSLVLLLKISGNFEPCHSPGVEGKSGGFSNPSLSPAARSLPNPLFLGLMGRSLTTHFTSGL